MTSTICFDEPLFLQPQNAVTVIRGSSLTIQVDVKTTTCKPVDLTGTRMVMTVKDGTDDTVVLFQKTSDVSTQITFSNVKGGIAFIFITPADTKHLEIKPYVYDVWLILPTGQQYPVVPPSTFDLQAGVTALR
jgi:hypothetical protein